jgi:DNA-binding phage protein
MDVANDVAKAMGKRVVTLSMLARNSGVSKGRLSKVLSGDMNLTINSMVRIFQALGYRFDLYVTPVTKDEWESKRELEGLKKKVKP